MGGPEQIAALSRGFSEITGSFGVGSLWLLALFLTLDAVTNAFEVVESVAQSRSWSIFVAVPVVVAAYVAGVLSTSIGGEIRQMVLGGSERESMRVATLARLNSAFLFERYSEFSTRRLVLDGAAPALLALAVALLIEGAAWNLHLLGSLLALPAILAACASLVLSERLAAHFDEALMVAETGTEPPQHDP